MRSGVRCAAPVVALLAILLTAGCGGDTATPAAPSSPPPSAGGQLHEGVPLGDDRYDLYVPAFDPEPDGIPAVIALHGRPGSSVESQAKLQPLADEEQFLVAYPRVGGSRWDLGPDSPAIAFLRELATELVDSWHADPGRIYLTGMSAGGDLAIAVGVQLSDVVAAVAPVAPPGSLAVAEVVDQLDRPVPVVAFLGAEDTRFFEPGQAVLARWRERAGCGDEQTTEAAGRTTTRWRCDRDTELVVHVVADEGHVWFGAPDARTPLWASEVMWDFFTGLTIN